MIVAAVVVAALLLTPPRRRRRARRGRARPATEQVELASQLAHVAALLRSGATTTDAWRAGLASPNPRRSESAGQTRARVAAEAARRLSTTTGCPLDEALTILVAALRAEARVDAAIEAGLAGPKATVRVLLFLPAVGLVLAGLLGAEPLTVLTGGGIGSVAAVIGVGLIGVGWLWSRALLRAAT